MEIDRREIEGFLSDTMDEMARWELPEHTVKCPYCGIPTKYPTVMRKQDIDNFVIIMKQAAQAMNKYGITGNLLADIKARCYIEIAKKNGKG